MSGGQRRGPRPRTRARGARRGAWRGHGLRLRARQLWASAASLGEPVEGADFTHNEALSAGTRRALAQIAATDPLGRPPAVNAHPAETAERELPRVAEERARYDPGG